MLDFQESTSSNEMTSLLSALVALKKGKTGVRLPMEWTGIAGRVADAFNDVVELNERMASELARLSRTVGEEGKLGKRLTVGDVDGFWSESVESVDSQMRNTTPLAVVRVTSVAFGGVRALTRASRSPDPPPSRAAAIGRLRGRRGRLRRLRLLVAICHHRCPCHRFRSAHHRRRRAGAAPSREIAGIGTTAWGHPPCRPHARAASECSPPVETSIEVIR